jgi:hypothetical protein
MPSTIEGNKLASTNRMLTRARMANEAKKNYELISIYDISIINSNFVLLITFIRSSFCASLLRHNATDGTFHELFRLKEWKKQFNFQTDSFSNTVNGVRVIERSK